MSEHGAGQPESAQAQGTRREPLVRVLIVDDDATLLALMRAALKESGCEVTAATSGQAALEVRPSPAYRHGGRAR